MKNLLIIVLVFIVGCTGNKIKESYREEGSIKLQNGLDKDTTIKYKITDYSKFKKLYSDSAFVTIIGISSKEAKHRCKYEPTYEPLSIAVILNHDTAVVLLNYRAKNAFGVPDEFTSYSSFVGTTLDKTL